MTLERYFRVAFHCGEDLSKNAYPGDIVFLNAQYDTSTQEVNQNTKKIVVTVIGAEKLNEKTYSVMEDVSYNTGKNKNHCPEQKYSIFHRSARYAVS